MVCCFHHQSVFQKLFFVSLRVASSLTKSHENSETMGVFLLFQLILDIVFVELLICLHF